MDSFLIITENSSFILLIPNSIINDRKHPWNEILRFNQSDCQKQSSLIHTVFSFGNLHQIFFHIVKFYLRRREKFWKSCRKITSFHCTRIEGTSIEILEFEIRFIFSIIRYHTSTTTNKLLYVFSNYGMTHIATFET